MFFGLVRSESFFDDFLALLIGVIFKKSRFFKSYRVRYNNNGELNINGKFFLGTFTNRNALSPSATGVFRIYKGGVANISGVVRIARDCKIYVPGCLTIGDGTYINPGTMILARTTVSIGSGCAIAWNCEIIDDDFHSIVAEDKIINEPSPISIGNHVWIGAGVKILKGVVIEDNVVVAAGSVVTKRLRSGRVYAGVPAKMIKENIKWK